VIQSTNPPTHDGSGQVAKSLTHLD